jgi:hypothetical protein
VLRFRGYLSVSQVWGGGVSEVGDGWMAVGMDACGNNWLLVNFVVILYG